MRNITVNKFSINSFVITILYFILYILNVNFFKMNSFLSNVQIVSLLGFIMIIYIYVTWRNHYYRIMSPYFVFIIMLYFTLCGQTIPWMFGIEAGYRDLTLVSYNGITFSNYEICRALLFSYVCILMTHSVVLLNIDSKTKKMKVRIKKNDVNDLRRIKNSNKNLYKLMTFLGISLIIISVIPYFYSGFTQYSIVKRLGYGAQYENISYGISSIFSKIGDFFPVGIITLISVWGIKDEYNSKNYFLKFIITYTMSILYLLMELLLSQRTGLILFLIALLFVFYSKKKIPKKFIFIGCFIALIIMAMMRMIDLIRSDQIYNFSDFLLYMLDINHNPVLDFLGDIGWNLMTTIEFQNLMPDIFNFKFGFSYLISMTSIIPNLNFWAIHPATVFGNISLMLQNYLNFSFGVGCTPVAEAYYNFSHFGFIMFIPWGLFFVSLNKKFEDNYSINCKVNNYQVVLFMGIMLKSVVRSGFYAIFRSYIFYVIIPVYFVKIIKNILSKN